jgi:hypothetical protein
LSKKLASFAILFDLVRPDGGCVVCVCVHTVCAKTVWLYVSSNLDRYSPHFDNRVPENRQIAPPAELIGPALEQMRYLEDGSALWSMYEEVLTKAVDKDQNANIHPSFTHIISQLSRDEAWILYRLRDRPFTVVDQMDFDKRHKRFSNRIIISSELPTDELYLADKVELLYSHLESLCLVTWPVETQTGIWNEGVQTGIRRQSKMMLTEFGRLFVSASIPEKGFEQHAKK